MSASMRQRFSVPFNLWPHCVQVVFIIMMNGDVERVFIVSLLVVQLTLTSLHTSFTGTRLQKIFS